MAFFMLTEHPMNVTPINKNQRNFPLLPLAIVIEFSVYLSRSALDSRGEAMKNVKVI